MRVLLIAIVLGMSGAGISYYQYLEKFAGCTEDLIDPLDRIKAELKEQGKEIPANLESSAKTKGEGPKVEVINGTKHDFGTMEMGASRRHKFVFKNVGTVPVSLSVKGSTCKCTIGDIEKPSLEPGDETSVELTWTAKSMLSEFAQTATIEVLPSREEIQLAVTGFVSRSLVFEPNRILLGEVSTRDSKVVKTTLYSHYEKPLEIKKMIWSDAASSGLVLLEWNVRKLEEGEVARFKDAKYAADITVSIDKGMPTQPLNAFVEVQTNCIEKESEKLQFSVVGKFLSDVRIIGGENYDEQKNIFTIGRVSSKEETVKRFLLGVRSDGGNIPKVGVHQVRYLNEDGVVVPLESLQVKIEEESRRGNQVLFRVELIVPKGAKPVSLMGTNAKNFGRLELETDVKFSERILVHLRLEVEE